LVKLSVAEADSAQFVTLAGVPVRIVTATIARFESRTVFRRLEAEGFLTAGEATALSADLDRDVEGGKIVEQAIDADVEREFTKVLERCFSERPPVFIRTSDALHLASAKVAGELEFITADIRQRAAAFLLGFKVLP
jgi:hypothetical protein